MRDYRECVVAVVIGDDGLILAGERGDRRGTWQLPQGGVDDGETPREALFRELLEEVGTGDVEIISHLDEKISYDFPEHMTAPIASKFKGQIQTWFLVKLNPGAVPSIEKSDHEFADLSWRTADDLLAGVVDWKRDAYKKGFKGFSLT